MKKALALAVTPAASFACDLSGTRMTNTNLSGTNLRNTNLGVADLKRAILKDTDLRGFNLRDANLSGGNFGPAQNGVRAYVKSCPSSLPNNN